MNFEEVEWEEIVEFGKEENKNEEDRESPDLLQQHYEQHQHQQQHHQQLEMINNDTSNRVISYQSFDTSIKTLSQLNLMGPRLTMKSFPKHSRSTPQKISKLSEKALRPLYQLSENPPIQDIRRLIKPVALKQICKVLDEDATRRLNHFGLIEYLQNKIQTAGCMTNFLITLQNMNSHRGTICKQRQRQTLAKSISQEKMKNVCWIPADSEDSEILNFEDSRPKIRSIGWELADADTHAILSKK